MNQNESNNDWKESSTNLTIEQLEEFLHEIFFEKEKWETTQYKERVVKNWNKMIDEIGTKQEMKVEIKKYRKKPVVIEAVQFLDNADCLALLSEWTGQNLTVDYSTRNPLWRILSSLENKNNQIYHWASVGDFIIKGVHGEFYLCKPDIFEKTYEIENNETTN